ncbi:MAG: Mur ligase [Rubrivivax sp.]|nr:Mur ligase [Rubrivivax sp.]
MKPLTETLSTPLGQEPEPNHGFEDSRRLTGANRWFPGPAVVLTPLGVASTDAAALARWAARVETLAAALGWAAPTPVVHHHAGGTLLVFAAPASTLFTATELNEWAWERSAAEAGETGFDIAQPFGDDVAVATLGARATAEHRPDVQALLDAAAAQGLPALLDDHSLSLGGGVSSQTWALTTLPDPATVPWDRLHDVPTALVTGSNGKTTTVRLLAAIAAQAGFTAGYSCTEGLFVGGQPVDRGDWAGPAGARAVLRHPAVTAAVLETARGGLLRRGLAVARADVAVVTNISPDHLGEYGVHSAADLAEVKLIVAHAVAGGGKGGGALVLNADDVVLMAAVARRLPQVPTALFAQDHEHPALQALRAAGGSSCGVANGQLLLAHAGRTHDLGPVAGMPITLGGAARHNVDNAAAAALAAALLGWPAAAITTTLQQFGQAPSDNPGRLERWTHRGATVLLDYAHNPEGLAQLLTVARALGGQRLGLLLGQAGNRDDAAITDLARTAAAFAPEQVVVKELPGMLRGRLPGTVPALIVQALVDAGLPPGRCQRIDDESAAAQALLAWAPPGDVLVLPVHTAAVRDTLVGVLRASAA